MSVKQVLMTPIALACSTAIAYAEDFDSSGFFGGTSFSYNQSNYTLTVPTSLFSDSKAAPYLPDTINMGISSSKCLELGGGYRWSGGNTNVGGLSWSFSTGVTASACSSRVSANLAPVKRHVLRRIDEEVRALITAEIDNVVPSEFYTYAPQFGIDTDATLGAVSDGAADYVLDPTQPVPSDEEITSGFYALPETPNPVVNDIRDQALQATLTAAVHVRDVRDAIGFVSGLPDYTSGSGQMFSLGWKNSARLRYHFAPQAYGFVGADVTATVKASFNANPFPEFLPSENVVVPFYGYEGVVSAGVAFQDVAGSWDVIMSGNMPFSNFDIPMQGLELSRDDNPYIGLSLANDNRASFGVTYTPKTESFGFRAELNF